MTTKTQAKITINVSPDFRDELKIEMRQCEADRTKESLLKKPHTTNSAGQGEKSLLFYGLRPIVDIILYAINQNINQINGCLSSKQSAELLFFS